MMLREEHKISETLSKADQNEIILESLSEGVCRLDSDGVILYANTSAKRMFKRNDSEVKGKFYSNIFFSKTQALFNEELSFCPIQFVLESGEMSHVSSEVFFNKEGEEFNVEYVCVPLVENDEVIGAVLSFQDISERFEAEKALAEARDLALEAAKAKAMFLANMSHEIRTPLNGVIGTTNLLFDTPLSTDQSHYVQMLQTSSDLLHDIVNDILDFSKLEAGKSQLEIIDFDVLKLVNETADVFRILAKKKGLELRVETDSNIPIKICGDANKIKQVLNNLLGNAVKFTESGEVIVKVSLREEEQNEIILHFEVADSGIGINAETQARLFQPFVQADSSTTRVFGGTGLGLAICKGLVEMMSGKIGVKSEQDLGAKFWFTAKFQKSTSETQNVVVNDNKGSEDKQSPETFVSDKKNTLDHSLKVLVVEDNPINREVASRMLEQIGLISQEVSDGLAALEKIESEDFDLVFMDCQMPRMDGYEATRKIRKNNKINQPKIIALTASATQAEREKCLEAGMDEYLAKPFTKRDLEEIIIENFDEGNADSNLDLGLNFVQHSLKNIIEPKRLENLLQIETNGKHGFVRDILNLYMGNTNKGIVDISVALEEKNIEVIKRKAHSLKGSSANIGLQSLNELFEKLELKSDEKDWSSIESFINKIIEEFEKTQNIIARI